MKMEGEGCIGMEKVSKLVSSVVIKSQKKKNVVLEKGSESVYLTPRAGDLHQHTPWAEKRKMSVTVDTASPVYR